MTRATLGASLGIEPDQQGDFARTAAQFTDAPRALPGTRIRITVDQWGAPVGSVVEVHECGPRWASYTFAKGDGKATTYLAGHDCYEVVGA